MAKKYSSFLLGSGIQLVDSSLERFRTNELASGILDRRVVQDIALLMRRGFVGGVEGAG